MLDAVKTNPAMPVYWGENQAGMQAARELDNTVRRGWCRRLDGNPDTLIDCAGTDMDYAKEVWLLARDEMVERVKQLNSVGLHKQIANRLLEPWMHITVLATATEHENFFSLRAHKDAQPEFQNLAYQMLELYKNSVPRKLKDSEWHIPFGDEFDDNKLFALAQKLDAGKPILGHDTDAIKLKIATARCARISYLNFDGRDNYAADVALADKLAESGHWSPFEHCAKPYYSGDIPIMSGNFIGWKQYRKMFQGETRRDNRVRENNKSS
jgi:hypothetical protein